MPAKTREAISEVLGQQYHAVVGNPPYITGKDKSLNRAYRIGIRHVTANSHWECPLPSGFFDICHSNGQDRCGYVGMITSNSFMKREFGKKLIEDFFSQTDLTHVVDTSGAYITGHGTPTVIVFGQKPEAAWRVCEGSLGDKGRAGHSD